MIRKPTHSLCGAPRGQNMGSDFSQRDEDGFVHPSYFLRTAFMAGSFHRWGYYIIRGGDAAESPRRGKSLAEQDESLC